MSWKILSQNFHSCNYDESKILEFSALFKIKSWNFLQNKILKFHDKLGFLEFSGPTIFLPAIFCLEIFCPGILFHGKYMDSPATPSSPSRTLKGLFELTRRPSRALDSPRALLPELQRYRTLSGVPR